MSMFEVDFTGKRFITTVTGKHVKRTVKSQVLTTPANELCPVDGCVAQRSALNKPHSHHFDVVRKSDNIQRMLVTRKQWALTEANQARLDGVQSAVDALHAHAARLQQRLDADDSVKRAAERQAAKDKQLEEDEEYQADCLNWMRRYMP